MKTTKRKIVYLRVHHLGILRNLMHYGRKSFEKVHLDYGTKFIRHALKIFWQIIDSRVKVKIIDEIDDICRACKWRWSAICRGAVTTAYDKGGANFFGIKIGRIYSSSTIIKKIKGLK